MSETDSSNNQADGSSEAPNETRLPDDHPLVKSLAAQKAEIKGLKTATAELDALKQAQMSEADKAAARIEKAESEAASVPTKVADALREHLVELHEIEKDDAELFLTGADPALLLKQVTRLLGQSDSRKKQNHAPKEGTTPKPTDSEEATFVRDLFGSGG